MVVFELVVVDVAEVLAVELGSRRSAYKDVMPRAPLLEDVMSLLIYQNVEVCLRSESQYV